MHLVISDYLSLPGDGPWTRMTLAECDEMTFMLFL
jgi:hypothetical protein